MKLLNLADHSLKCLRVVLRKAREDLTVELDALKLECVDEFAVGDTERAGGGIDADIPKAAHVIFLVATVGKSVFARMDIGLPRDALFL